MNNYKKNTRFKGFNPFLSVKAWIPAAKKGIQAPRHEGIEALKCDLRIQGFNPLPSVKAWIPMPS